MTLNRRQILSRLGGGVAATALLSLPAFAQSRAIRHFWWGNPERDRRTFEVIDIFKGNHPDIDISGETIGWGDYWTKMATQTAGGNMADLVQMDYSFLFEYVRRGALKPLDAYIGNGLDVESFDQAALAGGKVDGQLFALSIGSNSQVLAYNKRVFEAAGIEFNPTGWTREDFARICGEITEKTGVKGSEDLSLQPESFEVWVRQNGRNIYTEDGELGVTAQDAAEYWSYWAALREAGYVEGPDSTVVLEKPMNELGIVKGNSAMAFRFSNQLVALQGLVTDTVGTAMYPMKSGGDFGQYVKPSMFLALTRDAKDIEAAVAYMNDWVNDPASYKVLGLERGIPANPTARAQLQPDFTPIEAASVDYFNAIQGKVGDLPLPAPKGAGEVRDAFMRIGTNVVLGNMSPQDAAERYVGDAKAILIRANR